MILLSKISRRLFSPKKSVDRCTRRSVFARTALVVVLLAGAARAQNNAPAISPQDLPPLAGFVPENVGLFVEIDGLLEIGSVLREQNIWQVIEDLLAHEPGHTGWSEVLAASMGIESRGAMLRLFRERVALAATDWHSLSDGIIVFSLSNPRMIQSILSEPKAHRMEALGEVSLYRSHGGMWIARRGPTLAISRERTPLFEQCMALLDGRDNKSLANDKSFRVCAADLKAPQLAWAYWSAGGEAEEAPANLTGWWPALRTGALAVRRSGNALEITLRGAPQPAESRYQPRVQLDWLSGLPQLSLAAWATAVDAREVFAAARAIEPPAELAHIWELVTTNLDAQQFEDDVVSKVGPRCMIVFSANFRKPELDPQLALLVESVDASSVVAALRANIEQVIAGLTDSADGDESGVGLSSTDYLGVPIHELHWAKRDSSVSRGTLADLVTRDMTPAMAALDKWVVLATTADQVQELIDARNALTQRLGDVVPLADKTYQRAGSVAIMQTALTQSMVRYWSTVLAEERVASSDQSRLGIQVRSEPSPGIVIVDSIDSNGPADGLLQPGDGIIGCSGKLLDMQDTLPNLRTLINTQSPEETRALRVLRGAEILEIEVTPIAVPPPPAQGLAALIEQLGPVENLAGATSSVVLAVERPSPRGYRAKITVNLAQTTRPRRPTPATPEIPPE